MASPLELVLLYLVAAVLGVVLGPPPKPLRA